MYKSIPLLVSCAIILSGCVAAPVAIFGAATTVGTSAIEERGVGGVMSDTSISTRIKASWLAHDGDLYKNIDLQVREGRVLLSGTVDNIKQQIDAVRLVWKVSGVKEVIDETTVGKGGGFSGYASDSWISTKLKTQMLFDSRIQSINYNFQTAGGTVYLMGIAQNQEELDAVINLAKGISGVKKVVNYVRLKDDLSGNTNYGQVINSDSDAEGSAMKVRTN
jgi:osmotically-inducible protein OsmY